MFFKQVWRNAIRHRKDNGLFFGSLIIAIIAFYTLLSLKEQDVMRYLAAVESVAVSKLFKLIPLVYILPAHIRRTAGDRNLACILCWE